MAVASAAMAAASVGARHEARLHECIGIPSLCTGHQMRNAPRRVAHALLRDCVTQGSVQMRVSCASRQDVRLRIAIVICSMPRTCGTSDVLRVLVAPRELRETLLVVDNVSLHGQADILRRVVEDFHRLLCTVNHIARNTRRMPCRLEGGVRS